MWARRRVFLYAFRSKRCYKHYLQCANFIRTQDVLAKPRDGPQMNATYPKVFVFFFPKKTKKTKQKSKKKKKKHTHTKNVKKKGQRQFQSISNLATKTKKEKKDHSVQ